MSGLRVTVHPAHLRVAVALAQLLGDIEVVANRHVPLGDIWLGGTMEKKSSPRKLWGHKDKQAYWAELNRQRRLREAARRKLERKP